MIGWVPNPDQVNLHRVNPVWLMSYARWYKAQSLYTKQRFAKGVQRNITDFLKASITTDSIKIFSITFCTLVTFYCTCKIAKDAFRIVFYVTTFYMQHCTVARFVLKQQFVCSRDVHCCMLLKDGVFVLWINNFKCGLKTSVSLTGVFKVTSLVVTSILRTPV